MNVPSGYTELDLVGFTDKGDYSPLVEYVKNDLCNSGGNKWRCLKDSVTNVPPTEGDTWSLFFAAGDVRSWNGRSGSILPMAGDYNAEQITYDQTSTVDEGLKKAMGVDISLENYRNLTPTQKANGTYNVSTGASTGNIIRDGKIYGLDPSVVGGVETVGNTSASAYPEGMYLVCVNDGAAGLYKAKTAIGIGDTIAVGTNVEATSISEAFSAKRDLASIYATGSTNATGSTITKGTYFYLNGVFVKALSNIANGATFTIGTNVLQTRVGDMIGSILSEIGVGRTTGGTRTITLNGSYTAMDYCFLQIQWGSYPGSLVITTPITFTAPKTISFGITDAQGNLASAQYDVAYMFKGH